MKANRKFKEEKAGVSAVIGVILMVAITVAISATVYVYASGMMSSPGTITPALSFMKSHDSLLLTKGDLTTSWKDAKIVTTGVTFSNTTLWNGVTKLYNATNPGTGLTGISGTGTITISFGDHMVGTWNWP